MNKSNIGSLHMRIPIAFKLIAITFVLLLAATIPIAFKSAEDFEVKSGDRERDFNREQASARAAEVESLFLSYVDKVKVVAALVMKANEEKNALNFTFNLDKELVSVSVYKLVDNKVELFDQVVNEEHLKPFNLDKEYIKVLRQSRFFPLRSVFAGSIEIRNSSVSNGVPLVTIGVPFVKDDNEQISYIAVADILLNRLQKAFNTISERTLYLVDRDGKILAHPDEKLTMSNVDYQKFPVVEKALSAKVRMGETKFLFPETHQPYIGAFCQTRFGVTVISQASEETILEHAKLVRRKAFYITGISLSAAFFFVFLFSMSLTSPIERLVTFTKEISKGNFNIQARRYVKSHDEVGELATAFDEMTAGLRERDKVKMLFSKFHGSSVAEDMINRDIEVGGSRKNVTVFFSDIRGFTAFSENRTPEEVVEMLNEYFAVMVSTINRNGGIVDKFIGDAIMAIWGAPKATDRDPQKALRACLEMRKALAELNGKRKERSQPPIKIGMGLHWGEAISGTIGSEERMEYTVIGDTVNMASRIEASTKAFGTDLLVSEYVAEKVNSEFILESVGAAEVKGKSQPIKLFKVLGYIDEQGQPIKVETEYSSYASEKADKVKVAS